MRFTPHPKNAPGPFDVVRGYCLARTAPEYEAPDLMANATEEDGCYHCYFQKQPSTPEELRRAIRAIQVSCCQMVRYAGADPKVLARLPNDSCDYLMSSET
jgi:hypothetical protein